MLTRRLHEALQVIAEMTATGCPVTLATLSTELDLSYSGTRSCVARLIERGCIRRAGAHIILLRQPAPLPPEPVFTLAGDETPTDAPTYVLAAPPPSVITRPVAG